MSRMGRRATKLPHAVGDALHRESQGSTEGHYKADMITSNGLDCQPVSTTLPIIGLVAQEVCRCHTAGLHSSPPRSCDTMIMITTGPTQATSQYQPHAGSARWAK